MFVLKKTGRIRECLVEPGPAGEQLMASLGMLPRDRNDEADDLMTLWDIYELHDDDVLAVCERLIESRVVYFVR